MRKRTLSVIVISWLFCMVLAFSARPVSAAVELLDSGTAGPLSWKVIYDIDSGRLTTLYVTGNGQMPDYYPNWLYSNAPWVKEDTGEYRIGELELGRGLTRIGNYAFASRTSNSVLSLLAPVTIPDTVRSIGAHAFEGQVFARSFADGTITIPSSVTSIGEEAIDPYVTIVCHSGSAAYKYAKANGNKVKLTDVIKVGRPGSLKLKSPSKAKLKITFGAVSKAKGYEIQYGTKKNFSNAVTKTLKKRSYTVKLKSKKTYYVRVRAFKLDKEGVKRYGKWTAKKKLKLK